MTSRWKTWKVSLIVMGVPAVILAWLAFGERGLVRLHQAELERQDCIERIRELTEENQGLLEEIERLRTDMNYIESVARRELNLIRENEIVYRFDNPETPGSVEETRPRQEPGENAYNRNHKGLPHGKSR